VALNLKLCYRAFISSWESST